ncbi:unnamed protein product, partial [Symbiodinium sp. CCMP2456]
ATKELILKSNSSRHVAFIAARQVQCYIRILQSDNLTMAAIEACDYKLVDTSPLALTVPAIPLPPNCDVSVVAEHPCDTAWVTKNYQDVAKYWVAEQIAHATCMPCLDPFGSLRTSDIARISAEVRSGLTSAFHVRFLMEPHSVAMRMTLKVSSPEPCLGMSRNSAASMLRFTGMHGPFRCWQGFQRLQQLQLTFAWECQMCARTVPVPWGRGVVSRSH